MPTIRHYTRDAVMPLFRNWPTIDMLFNSMTPVACLITDCIEAASVLGNYKRTLTIGLSQDSSLNSKKRHDTAAKWWKHLVT